MLEAFRRNRRGSGPAAAGRSAEADSSAEAMAAVSAKILSDAPAQEIFDRIIESIAAATGAELVVLRTARTGADSFEVRAHMGLGLDRPAPLGAFSVSREVFRALCRSEAATAGGFLLSKEDFARLPERAAPGDAGRAGGRALLVGIGAEPPLEGFFIVGFLSEPPVDRAVSVLRFYADKVLHVLQRDRLRAELRDRERSLALCREELDGVRQLKSNFLSVVSHELRTPLTSIKAYTETLLENSDTIKRETLEDFLHVMSQENDRLISLVDGMLNFSKMEAGQLRVERTVCNLNQIVEEAHASLQHRFLDAGIVTELRLPRNPCRVAADRELMRQLLMNLLGNAAKFTPAAGRVVVTLEEEAAAARIVVQDTGPGIPEAELERIFERFYQVDASNTREHGGSGLGLAICKNIVDWHDGKIWVENVKGAGAKFVVLLPMKDIVVREAASSGAIGSRQFERERYLTLLVEMLAEFLQARKASIMLLDRDQQMLRIAAAKGLDPDFVQNTRLEVGQRIAGRVAETGEPLHVFDIESETDYGRANNALFYGTRSFISSPLKDGSETIGVLNVSDHVDGREFTRADREILEALGGIIAGMIKKLDAYEKVSANFEKLKEAMRSILDMREAWGSRTMLNLTYVALAIGRRLDLDERSLTALRIGMNLYDLGLMRVPRTIRVKREDLTARERETVREHANVGYSLASPMGLEDRIMKMVRGHHEHYDGTGYPEGLAGEEIPVEARIVSVVDAFRALMSEGPYRRPYTLEEARAEIAAGSGTRFDPAVVAAFGDALERLGARQDRHELVLEEIERELERERSERRQRQGAKDSDNEATAVKEAAR